MAIVFGKEISCLDYSRLYRLDCFWFVVYGQVGLVLNIESVGDLGFDQLHKIIEGDVVKIVAEIAVEG